MSALMASGSELAPLSLMSGSPIRMPSHMVTALLQSFLSALLEKRDKYEEACLERRKDFTPLCYSVDGMPCEAARSAERRLASLLAVKWDRQYSEMVNFIRTRMSLSVVRSNTLLLRSERAHSWKRRAPEDGSAATAAPTFRSE
eukprot:CCRYP_007724-RC/>CCRYP_007724-RC protein AED:0.39 eAED:0.37 QI:0/-1/0/1/-1/0/1/0/143